MLKEKLKFWIKFVIANIFVICVCLFLYNILSTNHCFLDSCSSGIMAFFSIFLVGLYYPFPLFSILMIIIFIWSLCIIYKSMIEIDKNYSEKVNKK